MSLIEFALSIIVIYLIYRDYNIRKIQSHNTKWIEKWRKGNMNRKWRDWYKINPEDHKKIALDPRPASKIAVEYNVSTSRISAIKSRYFEKQKTN